EADLEGVLVGDAVGDETGRSAGEHGLGLLVDGRLDTAAGDRARHLSALGHSEHRAGLARRRAFGLYQCGRGEPKPVTRPALQRVEDVLHGASNTRDRLRRLQVATHW